MSPDQLCEGGGWCPFACPPGQVMAQWNPDSSYTYPSSMDGGLYCNEDGELEVPFPDNPYCVDGSGSVSVVNEAGAPFTFCQTVLPGNEAMLIPTLIETEAVIAVPKSDYWCGTSSHFYINPPGVGEEGCIWGTDTEAIGNWSPFVAGANTASSGETYLKVGWNNEWLHATALNDIEPDYCLSIECDGCNGLPCSICAPEDGINGINAPSSGETADTGSFCVVTIPKGSTAKIVVTGSGSVSTSSVSSASSGGSNNNAQKSNESSTRETSTNDEPSTTSTGDDDEDKDTSTAKKDSETKAKTSSKTTSKSTASSSSKSASSTKSTKSQYDDGGEKGAVFYEQSATTRGGVFAAVTPTPSTSTDESAVEETSGFAAAASSDTQKDEGISNQAGPIISLVIALVVGLYLF